MGIYIIFVFISSIFSGIFDILKKKSVEKSSATATQVIFTGVAFLLNLFWIPFGISVSIEVLCLFAFKALILTVVFFLVFDVLKRVDVTVVCMTTIISTL